MTPLVKQVGRFASVGVVSTGLHAAVAIALNSAFAVAPLRANVLAFCVATLWSFIGNWAWTFEGQSQVRSSAPKFFAMSLSGFAVNQVIVYIVTEVWKQPMALAMVGMAMIVPAFSFWLSRTHIFTKPASA